MTKKFLTTQDLAKLLGVARYRIYEWIRDDEIPYLKTVGRFLFDGEEVENWLKRHRQKKEEEN